MALGVVCKAGSRLNPVASGAKFSVKFTVHALADLPSPTIKTPSSACNLSRLARKPALLQSVKPCSPKLRVCGSLCLTIPISTGKNLRYFLPRFMLLTASPIKLKRILSPSTVKPPCNCSIGNIGGKPLSAFLILLALEGISAAP